MDISLRISKDVKLAHAVVKCIRVMIIIRWLKHSITVLLDRLFTRGRIY